MKHNSPKASVKTLGCRLNQYEGQALEAKLRNAGYEVVPFGEPADVGVVNTCTVTNEADAKSRNAIRRFIRGNPNALTIVAGCYSQISANEVAMIQGVDYVIGNHDKLNFLDYLADRKPTSPVIIRDKINKDDFSIGFVGESRFEQRANLKVQDGCDFMCSFCVIPFARGRARSRDLNDLISEAKTMIASGVREIVLTGVNLGTYLSNGTDFPELIEKLSELDGLRRLRISSIEPTTISPRLFGLMSDPDHPLMPYLHIPLQSGSDKVLKLMKRKYSVADFKEFIEYATDQVPDITIGTDILVGFPGESEKEFEETCGVFWDLPFVYCHVFTYSERDGTPASKYKNSVPMLQRRTRSAHLRRLSAAKRMDFHKRHKGKHMRVLIENAKDGNFFGYTDHFLKVKLTNASEDSANRMASVKIGKAFPEYCHANILS